MPGTESNANAMKFGTPEKRRRLSQNYIAHVEAGYSDASVSAAASRRRYERYLHDFPVDIDTDLKEASRRKRQLFWEQMGNGGSAGKIKGFNALSWKFNMQNHSRGRRSGRTS